MARNLIYGLLDPRTYEVRYVGQTSQGMRRPAQHWTASSLAHETNKHKRNWLRQLLRQQLTPLITILEHVNRATRLDAREKYWIKKLRDAGVRLTNLTEGGCQPRGYKWSLEGRINQSWAQRQRFADPCERRAHGERIRRRWASGSFRKKMRAVRKAQFTDAVRVKIARTLGGKPIRDQNGVVYATIAAAASQLGLRRSGIQLVLRGKYTHTGGYRFSYVV
jgi:hypothetical protein